MGTRGYPPTEEKSFSFAAHKRERKGRERGGRSRERRERGRGEREDGGEKERRRRLNLGPPPPPRPPPSSSPSSQRLGFRGREGGRRKTDGHTPLFIFSSSCLFFSFRLSKRRLYEAKAEGGREPEGKKGNIGSGRQRGREANKGGEICSLIFTFFPAAPLYAFSDHFSLLFPFPSSFSLPPFSLLLPVQAPLFSSLPPLSCKFSSRAVKS